jgi:hypothetical protein
MRNLLAALLIAPFLAASPPCHGAETETQDVRAAARSLLEPGFHFVLAMPDYEPRLIAHDADPFSNWGDLVLAHDGAGKVTREAVRKRLQHLAKAAGWKSVKELPEVTPIARPEHYGITRAREDLDLLKRVDPKGTAADSCRIWIADDGASILVVYRIDSR